MTVQVQPPGFAPPLPAVGVPTGGVAAAHTTVISIGVMLLVIVILVELAGEGHEWAVGIGALLVSAILIAGFRASPSQLATIGSYPAVP